MDVAMIGSGYVGLVSGACFSEFGHRVVCVDKDHGRIAALDGGKVPIYEPGLAALIASNVEAGRLRFSTDLAESVRDADAIFLAVGTPSRRGDGEADLSFLFAAVREVAAALVRPTLIVTKSTVPVGTGRDVKRLLAGVRPDLACDIASNPEFLREGAAIEDFMRPDRVIVGCETQRARDILRELYRPLFLIETPVLFTSLETAELIKYAANAFLATKVTFINEIANLCEKVGADVHHVARGMGLDRRIGNKFLHPGPGYGGSCFPKDTRALASAARRAGAPINIVETVVAGNEARKRAMVEKIVAAAGGSVAGLTLAVLGVTFKPNTDDMRESPSLAILPALQAAGARIRAYDPHGMTEAKAHFTDVTWCRDAYDAMDGAAALIILTEWNQFRALDLNRAKALLRQPLMVDLRNIYEPDEMAAAGFSYHCVGRPVATRQDA